MKFVGSKMGNTRVEQNQKLHEKTNDGERWFNQTHWRINPFWWVHANNGINVTILIYIRQLGWEPT